MGIPGLSSSRLSRQQKTGFVLLLFFGILTIGLGMLQVRNTIYGPFVIRPSDSTVNTSALFDDSVRLQERDTDQDGLNDFEELQFYQTSPYLPDTDSDGHRDKDEIEAGTDPLCPEGNTCEAVTPAEKTNPGSPILSAENDPLKFLESVGDSLAQSETTLGASSTSEAIANPLTADAAALRQMLLNTGKITKEQLDQVDDATLLNLAKQIQGG